MNYHNKLLVLVLVMLIAILPIISAESLGNFKNGECVNLIQTCSNCTYANITTISYPNTSLSVADISMQKDGTFYHT
jgi:hypothetical protein